VLDDVEALKRLVDGLTRATKTKNLEWHKERNRSSKNLGLLSLGRLADARQYYATSRNASYSLSSSDSFGVAPYELLVRELTATSSTPTLEIESSTDSVFFPVNASLQRLFEAVEGSIEPTDNIVNRLLDGL